MEEGERGLKVIDYWKTGSRWKCQSLIQKLSISHIILLAAVALRPEAEQKDSVGWMKTGAGDFFVKKAYETTRKSEDVSPWPGWNLLWKVEAAQRVRVFSWILSHDRLLTNKER